MSRTGRITVHDGHPRPSQATGAGLDRRRALELMAAALATGGVAGCGRPPEEIVPYVEMPERLVPGVPLRFATALPLGGYGRGVVCTSFEGRPTKVEGNPRHPASLGATDPFLEAAVLGLYDPDRSQVVRQGTRIAAWDTFAAALLARTAAHARDGGEGLRLLTGRVTSPTLLRQIGDVLRRYPNARWHRHEAVDDDAAREGSRLAFGGRVLTPLPDLSRAEVVLALDADPLGPGPDQLRLARGWAARRAVRVGGDAAAVARLYAAEPVMSLTGANADHRLALPPLGVRDLGVAVAAALGADLGHPGLPPEAARFAEAAGRDLAGRPGRALVLAGPGQPPELHALAHWMNARLRAPVAYVEPVDPVAEDHGASLASLAGDMAAGRVATLLILGRNPVYDAPADLDFRAALGRVPFSVHLGLHPEETAGSCSWHLPQTHPLEGWSDLRAPDGTAAVAQPLIRPLHDTRSAHEVLAMLLDPPGGGGKGDLALVRETWAASGLAGASFEPWWRRALHDGVVPGTAAAPVTPPEPRLPEIAPPPEGGGGMALVLRPDDAAWDGAFSNNAWLQECPRPVTRQVWGNALGLHAEDAAALGVADGDLVRVEVERGQAVEATALVRRGQARGVASLTLGYGRTEAVGRIGVGLGADAYRLRTAAGLWTAAARLTRTGGKGELVLAQHHFDLEGRDEILPSPALHGLPREPKEPEEPPPSLMRPRDDANGYDAWAMVIDTGLCIGCNACVLACQSENNVPVVGPVEVERGRLMHWIRIDTYELGQDDEASRPGFQPVPCMHCEHAPCEPVCPVEASVHDHEGLNVQVYNRCVGTRFCESNCPYKVRRFNFYAYANGQEYENLGHEAVAAQRNPEVTVRARGVMEKCTYCVQRISRARRTAEREDRPIAEGEVVTACQSACPTSAIVFGDLAHPDSPMHALRREPQHFALLEELGTRPRTTYLGRVRNPSPDLEPPGKGAKA